MLRVFLPTIAISCLVLAACDGGTSFAPNPRERISELAAVAFGAGQFVGVGGSVWADDAFVPNSDSIRILTSPDGVTWDAAATATPGWLYAVVYGEDRFVAVGNRFINVGQATATPLMFTSLDGNTWQAVSDVPAGQWQSVAYGAGRFVAIGVDAATLGSTIVTSPDGESWTEPEAANVPSAKVTYGDAGFVLWGESATVGVSADGIDWEFVTMDAVNIIWDIAFLDGRYFGSGVYDCCSGEASNQIDNYAVTSDDGRAWTVTQRLQPDETFYHLAFGAGSYVAVGERYLFLSSDGSSWQSTVLANTYVGDITYGSGRFVAVGQQVLMSEDGNQWWAAALPR